MSRARRALLAAAVLALGVGAPGGGATTQSVRTSDGGRLAVTLLRVVDGARAERALERPNFRWRYVVVDLRLRNPGERPVRVPADAGARMIGSSGEGFAPWPVDLARPPLAGAVVPAGGEALVHVTFQVPARLRLRALRLALARDGRAAWAVRGRSLRVLPRPARPATGRPAPAARRPRTGGGAPVVPTTAPGPRTPRARPAPGRAPAAMAVVNASPIWSACVTDSPYGPLVCPPPGGDRTVRIE